MEIPASAEKVGTCTNPNLATTKKKIIIQLFWRLWMDGFASDP